MEQQGGRSLCNNGHDNSVKRRDAATQMTRMEQITAEMEQQLHKEVV